MPKFKSAEIGVQMPADGIVEGYAATFDREPDSYGDVIAKGAFARTLDEWRVKSEGGLAIPLLYGHNTDDPLHNIGKVTEAYEDEKGLFVHAEFDADNPNAQYARKLAAEGRLYQFSFAYAIRDAAEVQIDGHYAYELRDLDLYEVSLVQIPANQHAVVTGIKSDDPATSVGTLYVDLKPRIAGLTDEQRDEFTKAIAEATHNGLEIGLKAGRRNSKADADELRSIRELANQITSAINGLLADEETDADEQDGGPEPEVNAEEPEGVNAEEPTAKDAESLESAKSLAAAVMAAAELINF
jgi:HK97 family phage prohead protease